MYFKMNVMQTEEHTLGIAKFPIIQLHTGSISKLLNFMTVTFNVLKLSFWHSPALTVAWRYNLFQQQRQNATASFLDQIRPCILPQMLEFDVWVDRRNTFAFQSLFCDFVQRPIFCREFNYPLCNLKKLYLLTLRWLHIGSITVLITTQGVYY